MPVANGIYLGRSNIVSGGHVIAPIQWNQKTKMWDLQHTIHRKSIVDSKWDVFPLTKSISTGANPAAVDFNKLLDKFNMDAVQSDVYTVDKIHKSRVRREVKEYQCTWKGYSKKHKTWEPESHLLDYGARG